MDNKGFTLIEMVMVITLLGIIGGIIALPLYIGTKGWFEATTREGITESGRIAIERMAREIRNTAKTAADAPCILSATATSISFSTVSDCSSPITFSLAVPNIQRTDASGTSNLASDVTSFDINYYNSANGVIARPVVVGNIPTIRRLSIEIVSTSGGETLRKYSEVYLSNMKGY